MAVLVSLADYKTYAGLSGTSQDSQLTMYLGMASGFVRNACGRDPTNGFELTARTEKYNGTGIESFRTVEKPITVLTSVSWLDADGTATAITATDYRWEPDGIITWAAAYRGPVAGFGDYGRSYYGLNVCPNWGNEPQSIQVVYTAGFSTIPADLQWVVCQIVDAMRANAGSNSGMKSESTGAQSYTRFTPEELQRTYAVILKPYLYGGA